MFKYVPVNVPLNVFVLSFGIEKVVIYMTYEEGQKIVRGHTHKTYMPLCCYDQVTFLTRLKGKVANVFVRLQEMFCFIYLYYHIETTTAKKSTFSY